MTSLKIAAVVIGNDCHIVLTMSGKDAAGSHVSIKHSLTADELAKQITDAITAIC